MIVELIASNNETQITKPHEIRSLNIPNTLDASVGPDADITTQILNFLNKPNCSITKYIKKKKNVIINVM